MKKELKSALKVVFRLTGAEYIEIHSGIYEPGHVITRKDLLREDHLGGS